MGGQSRIRTGFEIATQDPWPFQNGNQPSVFQTSEDPKMLHCLYLFIF